MKLFRKICFRPESLLLILLLLITFSFTWKKENWHRNILSSDGRGYYAYLPAIFLFQDLTYQSNTEAIEKELGYEMSHHYILKNQKGKTFNKTFPGVAICLAPLFLLATFLSFLFGGELNGYTDIYLIAVQLSAILACIIGYYYLKKLLLFKKVSIQMAVLLPLLVIFGTNVFFYTCNAPSMGHIYSFMMMSVFTYYISRSLHDYHLKYLIYSAISFAMILLLRPTNGVVILLIPYLAGSFAGFTSFLKQLIQHKKDLIYTIAAGGVVLAILPIIWYLQTGSFVVWSYTGEGFYFSKPLIHKVLFSFRNGMFVYAPLSFLLLGGIYFAFRKDKFAGTFALLYFLINVYIISSWWTFYYGGGFGHRAMTEHHVFTLIMLATLLQSISNVLKNAFYGLSMLLVGLSVFQGFQMNKGILPGDYINAEMYGLLFLKWDDKYIGECNATLDSRQYGKVIHIEYKRPINYDLEPEISFDKTREFGGDASYILPEVEDNVQFFLEYNYTKKRMIEEKFNDVFFVLDCKDLNDQTVYYESKPLYDIRSEALNKFKILKLTLQLPKNDIVKYNFYIWNKGRKSFVVKDIDIRIMLVRP